MSRKKINRYLQCLFISVPQSCLTLCNPMDCSTPSLPVHHHLPEFTQTHIHRVSDAIQPSHPLFIPFSSCLQSFPASGSFPMSQFFVSGGASASASVLRATCDCFCSAFGTDCHLQLYHPEGKPGTGFH